MNNVHEGHATSPCSHSHASTSNANFPTLQHMKEFRQDYLNSKGWEAALDVEIEIEANLEGGESSPPHSNPRRGPHLKIRRITSVVAQQPSLEPVPHRKIAQPSRRRKNGSK